MRRLPTRVAAAALPAACVAGMLWLSHYPMAASDGEAVLRLAWSARPDRIETCRELGADELQQLPAHMRQRVVCEGRTAEYRLRVAHDGRSVLDRVVRGGGLRQDRRLYVFVEVPLRPGEADVEVTFERTDLDAAEASPTEPARSAPGVGSDHVPARLAFRRTLRLEPREVALVTYEATAGALVLRRRP
ncbi:MAG TPA: hypothetical protein VF198_05620 [Vicinamibacterales bacterium]